MAVTTTSLAVKDQAASVQSLSTHTNPAGDQRYAVDLDTPGCAAYRTGALFTPLATAAVTLISIIGSATKTVRVRRITMWGAATANASIGLQLVRGTALGAGGTAVAPTIQKMDSGTVASATAVVKHYTTAAQSAATGSSAAILATFNLFMPLVAETVDIMTAPQYTVFPEGGYGGPALVLRGTGDILEVQLMLGQSGGANAPPGGQYGYAVEFVEDGS